MTTIEVTVPEGIDARAYARFITQLASSRTAVNRVATVLEQQEQPVGPGTAFQLAAVERLWRHLIDSYGVYDAREIAAMRGSAAGDRSVATRMAKKEGLIGFNRGRSKVYPRFEFQGAEVHPQWRPATQPLREAGWENEDILLWFVAPHPALDGMEPAAMLATDAGRVVMLAEAKATRDW